MSETHNFLNVFNILFGKIGQLPTFKIMVS